MAKKKAAKKKTAVKVKKKPARAPQKKILRADRTLHVVPEKAPKPAPVPVPAVTVAPARAVNVAIKVEKKPLLQAQRLAWSVLPNTVPPQFRFYLSMAEKECIAASSWPFPFARFISALPARLCGLGFALQLLALDHDDAHIASLVKMEREYVEELLARERAALLDACTELCPEVFRKLKTQLGGVGVSIDTLIERYLVNKADKNFQLTVGALVLRALA